MIIFLQNFSRKITLNNKTNINLNNKFFTQSNFVMMRRANFTNKYNSSQNKNEYYKKTISLKNLKDENYEKKDKKNQRAVTEVENFEFCHVNALIYSEISVLLTEHENDAGSDKNKQKDLDSLNNQIFECLKKKSKLEKPLNFKIEKEK